MNPPKISIIVPVYNVEAYLDTCLSSLSKQTLNDIEIIVVNDCSPDNSQAIIDTYCNSDERFICIKHQQNKGHGGALNTGIKRASGKYVWLIDSDDLIDINACEFLYSYAEKYKTDILAFGANDFIETENGRQFVQNHKYAYPPEMTEQTFTGDAFIFECLLKYSFIHTPPWGYLIKKDILDGIRFRENVSFEDTDGTGILLNRASQIKCLKYSPYYRLIHTNNSVDFLRDKKVEISEKVMNQRMQVVENFLVYIEENSLKKNSAMAYMCFRYYSHAVSQELARFYKQDIQTQNIKSYDLKLKKQLTDVLGTDNFGKYKRKYRYDELLFQAAHFPAMSSGKKIRFLLKWLLTKLRLNWF